MELNRSQKLLIIIGLAAVLVGLLLLSLNRLHSSGSGGSGVTVVTPAQSAETSGPVVVHLIGAVVHPGLYTLTSGSRVADLINQSGGFTADADQSSVNLAAVLQDGEQIKVGVQLPPQPTATVTQSPAPPLVAQPTATPEPVPGPPPAKPPTPTIQVISLNQATKEQLETLPGIGPQLSARILYYRHEHGAFKNVEDLARVEGIGPTRLEAIRPLVKP
jgi:competence protein ComEA